MFNTSESLVGSRVMLSSFISDFPDLISEKTLQSRLPGLQRYHAKEEFYQSQLNTSCQPFETTVFGRSPVVAIYDS